MVKMGWLSNCCKDLNVKIHDFEALFKFYILLVQN